MRLFFVIFFCCFSIAASIGISYALYPHVIISETQLANSAKPQDMESFEKDINLGDDFGEMSVIDLMGYYLENPPAPKSAMEQSKPKRQFGGC